jgi:hypothetical protein
MGTTTRHRLLWPAAALLLAACGSDSVGPNPDPFVDLFRTPVAKVTSRFPNQVDNDTLSVAFTQGFTFTFYGTTYDRIVLNTNGGFTFGGGDAHFDIRAIDAHRPGVAVFWGDMDAGATLASQNRPNQMQYQQQPDRFVIRYAQFQDHDEPSQNNTATVTLRANGTITIQYGVVGSTDALVGVFDGAHTNDQYMNVTNYYANYAATGSGVILFDRFGPGPIQHGQLNNRTITFQAP